jgi:hypothetical protein
MDNEETTLDIIDAAFVGLCVLHVGFIPFALAQYAYRHTSIKVAVDSAAQAAAKRLLPIARRLPRPDDDGKPDAAPTPTPTTAPQAATLPTTTLGTIASGDNILLVGNKGSGKSTLLDALIAARAGGTVVLDPHYTPGAWQGAARVVGKGRDYEGIGAFLSELKATLDKRYQGRANGKSQWNRLTVCGDEYRSIAHNVDGAGTALTAILTEGRKVSLCVLAAAHNDTVSALGCKGDKDSFINSFDWIVYTGAFASQRFPSGMQVPSIATAGGDIPALAYAHNVNTARAFALDLRVVPTAAPTPSPKDDDELLLTLLLGERSNDEGAVLARSEGNERQGGERSNGTVQAGTAEAVSDVERSKTALALELHSQGKSKRASVETAWSVRKGGSPTWARASQLFDAARAGNSRTREREA